MTSSEKEMEEVRVEENKIYASHASHAGSLGEARKPVVRNSALYASEPSYLAAVDAPKPAARNSALYVFEPMYLQAANANHHHAIEITNPTPVAVDLPNLQPADPVSATDTLTLPMQSAPARPTSDYRPRHSRALSHTPPTAVAAVAHTTHTHRRVASSGSISAYTRLRRCSSGTTVIDPSIVRPPSSTSLALTTTSRTSSLNPDSSWRHSLSHGRPSRDDLSMKRDSRSSLKRNSATPNKRQSAMNTAFVLAAARQELVWEGARWAGEGHSSDEGDEDEEREREREKREIEQRRVDRRWREVESGSVIGAVVVNELVKSPERAETETGEVVVVGEEERDEGIVFAGRDGKAMARDASPLTTHSTITTTRSMRMSIVSDLTCESA
ncbi:hypothetical protein HK101_002507 [Irineochytrium annulatum]|nr:hypothetical protein HK101_002507 [Irineochytrium annulatum]